MKYLLVLIFVAFLSACGDKNSSVTTSPVEKIPGPNIEGTYIAPDKTEIVIKDGILTLKAHGPFPARHSPYKVINNRVEFTWDTPGFFIIKDNGNLSVQGLMDYTKQ